ncbi:MAG: ATP phosphoribosyltransferase [Candidatus Gastranaerophilales bacterium]|nr:ATP phosphoribosyltransferase [Candidatus Gastranaerophilales bacterium]
MEVLRIAVPNKGRMSEKMLALLERAGLNILDKKDRCLSTMTEDGRYSIIFLRTKDIPKFIQNGTADIGFTGIDVVEEAGSDIDRILDLDFGKCDMVLAVKDEDPYTMPEDLPNNLKVVTSFPNITKKYFEKIGKQVQIIEVAGATEITPRLGLADAIVDITSSGSTLKMNKLRIIDNFLKSSAVIIGRPGITKELPDEIETFVRAVKSAIIAEDKKYLMANFPKNSLDSIKDLGLKSPTVTTLIGDDENVAIHIVINKNEVYSIVDRLKKLGATGILILAVDQVMP